MKSKRILIGLLTMVMTLSMTGTAFAIGINDIKVTKGVKNVILLIPDGMSTGALTLTRWYNGGGAMNLDSMASGLVRTYSSDAPIADSAPAGTAMATGYKSHTARLDGKATGIITTSEIMHATPADFTAHDPSRKNYDSISEQQVYQNADVVIGAGTKYFTSEVRGDKEDLISVIKDNYQYATTPSEFEKVKNGKLWAMFAPAALSYDYDRNPDEEPSLAEMTDKAIDLLSQDKEGFFLMIEGRPD